MAFQDTLPGANGTVIIVTISDALQSLATSVVGAISAGVQDGTLTPLVPVVSMPFTVTYPTPPAGTLGYVALGATFGMVPLPPEPADYAGYVSGAPTSVGVTLNQLLYQNVIATSGDFDTAGGDGTLVLAASASQVTATAPGGHAGYTIGVDGAADTVTATVGNNAITVAGGDNLVGVGGGDNTVYAAADPTIQATGDTIVAGSGNASVNVASGNDLIAGGSGKLTFINGSGQATAIGGSGSSSILGGSGGGLFGGGSGGSNLIIAGLQASTIFGGGSGDQLFAFGISNDLIAAGSGNETLSGLFSSGNDAFFGGSGNDLMGGGSGNNVLLAGTGNDTMIAGSGADLFVFANGQAGGTNLIEGFNAAAGDRVSLQNYGADAVQAALGTATIASSSTTIGLADHTTITLAGVTNLDASAFA